MKKSTRGEPDFFWLQDKANGQWVLGRQLYRKNGKPNRQWREEKRLRATSSVAGKGEVTEEMVRPHMQQAENDLLMELAAGDRS